MTNKIEISARLVNTLKVDLVCSRCNKSFGDKPYKFADLIFCPDLNCRKDNMAFNSLEHNYNVHAQNLLHAVSKLPDAAPSLWIALSALEEEIRKANDAGITLPFQIRLESAGDAATEPEGGSDASAQ
jgi:hypothetical protein